MLDDTDHRRLKRTCNDIVHETIMARRWDGFPMGAINIANDGSGNHLIVRAASDAIEFWDHETGESTPVHVFWRD